MIQIYIYMQNIIKDVSYFIFLKNLVDRTVEKYGRIDCLVNNAGWRKLITDHSMTGLNGNIVFFGNVLTSLFID